MSPVAYGKFLHVDGSPLLGDVVAIGRTGVVIKHDGKALKLPRREDTSACTDSERKYLDNSAAICRESLEREMCVYRHLGGHNDIIECFGMTDAGIEMTFLENGDLADYIQHKPERSLRLSWIQQMANAIKYVHEKKVIIADIATRNFLIADDLSIKLCDFTEATIMPPEVNMDKVDDSGYSVQTDIAQFGAVLYEVVTGKPCDFDLFKGQDDHDFYPKLPSESDLPSTANIWPGSIIRSCWTKNGYQNMNELCRALALMTAE